MRLETNFSYSLTWYFCRALLHDCSHRPAARTQPPNPQHSIRPVLATESYSSSASLPSSRHSTSFLLLIFLLTLLPSFVIPLCISCVFSLFRIFTLSSFLFFPFSPMFFHHFSYLLICCLICIVTTFHFPVCTFTVPAFRRHFYVSGENLSSILH